MTKVRFKGTIHGGPHDGSKVTFEGTSQTNFQLNSLGKQKLQIEFQGHLYNVLIETNENDFILKW